MATSTPHLDATTRAPMVGRARPQPRSPRTGPWALIRAAGVVAVLLGMVLAAVVPAGPVAAQGGPGSTVPPTTTTPSTTTPTTTPPTTTATAPPTTTVARPGTPRRSSPPPISPVQLDQASIQQLTVEARRLAELTRAAELATAVADTAAARTELATAQADLDSAAALAATAAAITAERERAVEATRRRISGIAADAYMRVGTDRDDVLSRLRVGSGGTDPGYVDAQQIRVFADQALIATREDLRRNEQELEVAVAERAAADRSVADRTVVVEQRRGLVTAREAVEVGIRNRPIEDEVTANVASLLATTGPTILGESLVGAEDLAAFVRARGRPHPSVNVEELAVAFVDEGGAEGVRADLAWVQSILETGWFSFANSMVFPGDHNYAGVGACDTCRRGFIFDTPQLGARAQMQLLKAYADPTTTAASLARPSVLRPPERLSVRGCCSTWMALAGVWATNQQYGVKILTLYDELLRFSAKRRASLPSPAPAG